MEFLLLNQFFAPDAAPTSQLLSELAAELVRRGHSVTVICGGSTYSRAGSLAAPGVRVRRIKNTGFGRGMARRLASYLTYMGPALAVGLFVRRPEAIVSMTTPPGLPVIGGILARMRGARHYVWEMDVYPDVAEAVGVIDGGSVLAGLLRRIFDYPRWQADGIVTLGECMAQRMESHGLRAAQIRVIENWTDGSSIRPLPFRGDGRLRVLYSGNLGLVHDVDTIGQAMLRLRGDERFEFVFAGGGQLRGKLEAFCREQGLGSAAFADYCEREELAGRIGGSDVGLVTQKREARGCVVPSKVYGVMAAGRPVLFIGPGDTALARMIRRFECGWHVECGAVDGLVELLGRLAGDGEAVREAGARARAAFEGHYDLPAGVGRLCEVLTSPAAPLGAEPAGAHR